jgi:two-component system, chemotaxis family, CheB/CheR fusion protein
MAELVRPDSDPESRAAQREQLAEGETVRGETIHHRQDGTPFWVESTTSALFDPEGQLTGLVAVVRDITERKEAEQALAALNETLEARVRLRTKQVRSLVTQLTMSEQEERRRISQLLHDDLQQQLYSIQFQLHILRRTGVAKDGDVAQNALNDIEETLMSSVQIARDLSVDLSPPVLHNEGLVEAVRWLASHMERQFGLVVDVQAETTLPILHADLRVLLFQVVRELLFNIIKHAGVSHAVVALAFTGQQLRIEVSDQGRGFDAVAALSNDQSGHGLLQVQQRLQLIDGDLQIESALGEGTRVTLYSPLIEQPEY